tara:strand:+ start:210 stop:734 length:525 start_codon:yes stop_codon:yes gene_type:complete
MSIGENIKSKSYDTYNWRDDFHPIEIESIDIIKPDPLVSENASAVVGKLVGPMIDATKVALGSIASMGNTMRRKEKEEQKELDDKRIKSKKKEKWTRDDDEKINEGNRTRKFGINILGSGNLKDYSKGPNEKPLLDYSKIRAKAPITNDGKKKIDPSKNEVIAASYSWRNELGL